MSHLKNRYRRIAAPIMTKTGSIGNGGSGSGSGGAGSAIALVCGSPTSRSMSSPTWSRRSITAAMPARITSNGATLSTVVIAVFSDFAGDSGCGQLGCQHLQTGSRRGQWRDISAGYRGCDRCEGVPHGAEQVAKSVEHALCEASLIVRTHLRSGLCHFADRAMATSVWLRAVASTSDAFSCPVASPAKDWKRPMTAAVSLPLSLRNCPPKAAKAVMAA